MIDIAEGLSAQQRGTLGFLSQPQMIPPGALVYKEGDPAYGFYQVVSGEVQLIIKGPDGGEQVVAVMKDSDYFGFAGVATGRPVIRMVTARASMPTSILELPGNPVEVFEKNFGPGPACQLMRNVLKVFCDGLLRIVELKGEFPRTAHVPLGSDVTTPEDPAEWLVRVEAAVPTGLMANLFATRKAAAGDVLLAEGAVAEAFSYVSAGTVDFVQGKGEGARVLLTESAPATFGHLSFFTGRPMPFSAVARTAVTTRLVSQAAFQAFIRSEPEAGLLLLDALLRLFASRLNDEEVGRQRRNLR